ncbi:hypothetical protein M408DRAFT_65050 [Serendipita vermifera MAFF 305830]|uniref:BSD domain-containing protein n=1 Tax=Serendipita vermifera MAFF 305830 TaxID=933852 RepID=A0A0C3BGX2_SERVB|nr:hypothetical protein M408DRAFT_65050 [Serendipita vermifera MAFF 305830]
MFRLRKKVLLSDPELAALHRAVVIKGKLSETDFWATRQNLIDEAAVADAQKRGKSSRLVDPKPALSTTGDMKVVMTPQLALDIFEEWPVVARAFRENVSSKMTEAEFWKRYFESRLYHNHKASVRSSAAQHIIKEDVIFDQYLERVDDELEPRNIRQDPVNVLVNLVATREDHGETGNTQDVTMQAGKQKSTLPLIRKFNEHSERLLNSALGQMKPVKRARLERASDQSVLEEIDMEDLHAGDNRAGITLDMKNRQRYFEGRSATNEGSTNVDFKTALGSMKSQLGGWDESLKNIHQASQPGVEAVRSISQNIHARTKVKSTKLDVSPDFLKQMRALEASTNEYLRHFWFLILPPAEGVERLGGEERGKKVGLMRDELLLVQRRGPELVHIAATNRWDSAGVEEALKPMMGAIDKALGFVAGRG